MNSIITQKSSSIRLSKINQAFKFMADFYGNPLDRAIVILIHTYNWTFDRIAKEIFLSEVTKQAVQNRISKFLKEGENHD